MASTSEGNAVSDAAAHEAVEDTMTMLTGNTADLSLQSPANPAIPPANGTCPFAKIPLEVREMIYAEYLKDPGYDLDERRHEDNFGNECCFWEWPEELIACDKLEREVPSPHLEPFFIPPFARASKALMAEVARYMIRSTRQFVLRSNRDRYHSVKISDYFADFAKFASTEDYNAFSGIRELVFPHFSHRPSQAYAPNQDLRLAVQCPNLRKLSLTFHSMGFVSQPFPHRAFVTSTFGETVEHFNLKAILDCKALQELYLTGIRPKRDKHMFPDGVLYRLEELGVWAMKHFLGEGKDLKVFIHRRRGRWEPDHPWKEFKIPADGREQFIPIPRERVFTNTVNNTAPAIGSPWMPVTGPSAPWE